MAAKKQGGMLSELLSSQKELLAVEFRRVGADIEPDHHALTALNATRRESHSPAFDT